MIKNCKRCGGKLKRVDRQFCSNTCSQIYRAGDPIKRLWVKVDKRGINDCWLWTASKTKRGYGSIGWNGRVMRASRVIYELTKGKIPPGYEIMHSCDNPPCCNPKHLFAGTHTDNMQDMLKKKRGNKARAEYHGRTKLKRKDVIAIRKRRMIGGVSYESLAKDFGTTATTVRRIVLREVWDSVP